MTPNFQSPNPELLKIQQITQKFGGLTAITNCNLSIDQNQTFGIIGPNGAGKTTLFNLITGIYRPTTGKIYLRNKDITGLRPNAIAARGVARTFQNIRLFRNLTVLENVRIAYDLQLRYTPIEALLSAVRFRKQEQKSIDQSIALLELFQLQSFASKLAGDLAYGLQRKLEIARAIATNPSILLLDEPAAGMNPSETGQLVNFLQWIRNQFSLTLVLIEHHMQLVMTLCDRIAVLDFGATIATGTPNQIRNNPAVIEAYLGEMEDDKQSGISNNQPKG